MPDPCGVCGSRAYRRERCEECPSNQLDRAMEGPAGRLLGRAIAKRSMVKMGLTLGMDDLDAEEFLAMEVLEVEVEKYQDDVRKREEANRRRR